MPPTKYDTTSFTTKTNVYKSTLMNPMAEHSILLSYLLKPRRNIFITDSNVSTDNNMNLTSWRLLKSHFSYYTFLQLIAAQKNREEKHVGVSMWFIIP